MTRLKAAVGAVGILVSAGSLAIIPGVDAAAPPAPRFGENYRLPPLTAGRGRDVPGLAVNPANPNHIVEAENDPVNLQCDYRVSFDGGRTWTGGHLRVAGPAGLDPPFGSPACTQNFDSGGYMHFNTGIAFGSGANVYVTFSVHRGAFNRPESNVDGGVGDDAVVARSTDGGRTFAPATLAVEGGGPVSASPGLAGRGLRPQLAVDRGAGTGGADRLYIATWHCYIRPRASSVSPGSPNGARGGCSGGGGDRRVLVARSNDGGQTWSDAVPASATNVRTGTVTPPSNIPPGTGAAAEAGSTDEQAREPSQPVVGPDGAIYVAYRNRDITDGTTCPVNPAITSPAPGGFSASMAHCIVVARSTNQGQTWSQFSTNVPVSTATLSNPRLAIDPTTPGGVGTLYVTYQRPVPGDPSDISVQSSTDRGQTWSAPVRANDDAAGTVQTNPWVSVGPSGRVDMIWADRRHQYVGASQADMYYARSTNGSASFEPNRRVTDRTINIDVGRYNEVGSQFTPGFSWFGPVSLPLADGRVLGAWQDSREGNVDSQFQDIYLSRLDPAAGIAKGEVPTATGPGLSVRLSRLSYPGGPEAVGERGGEPVTRLVVANEDDRAAALAGAVLARAHWAPLLLSPSGGLPGHVRDEASRMKAEGAFVLGSTSSLSTAVSEQLRQRTRNGEGVVRVAAPTNVPDANKPADLARRIAELMRPLGGGASPTAVIANPQSPEAASAAGMAAALKMPILFVDNRATLPPPTSAAIASLGIKNALIVGGIQAVNAGVQTALNTLLGAPNVKRLDGADQYATSEAVLAESRLRGLPANVVYVADGDRPVDAAVLGAAAGRLNGLMLLRPGADAGSADDRLTALGVDPFVDRIVAASGTGGTDPATSSPRPPTTTTPLIPPAALALAACPRSSTPRNVVTLSNGDDTRNGTARGDLIFAGAGNDAVDALGGDDCVDLGPGADRGVGGVGNDLLLGGLGRDAATGGSGNDRLLGHADRDTLSGGSGRDRLDGGSAGDRISGGGSRDRMSGSSGDDALSGGSGDDRMSGGAGRDRLSGGSGNDRIGARDGSRDRIACGGGRDRVVADRIDRVARSCERVSR